MTTDESHDEALPKTAHADGRRCVLPLYHGNAAETDLKAVGDIEQRPISPLFVRGAGKFALARMLQMQLRLY